MPGLARRWLCRRWVKIGGTRHNIALFCCLAFLLPVSSFAVGPLRITEFAAAGRQGVTDEDGDSPDWIEIQNTSSNIIDLAGWKIGEYSRRRPFTWQFPPHLLAPGDHLLLFASGKDRGRPGQPLHTNFKLPDDGGRLRLESPDGESSSIAPYPPQLAGISFGIPGSAQGSLSHRPLAEPGSPLRFYPAFSGRLGNDWTLPEFNDKRWFRGKNGIGFSFRTPGYADLLETDLGPLIAGRSTGIFLRLPFVVDRELTASDLILHVAYDDGIAVWLNGSLVAQRNVPETLTWNSSAPVARDDNAGPGIEAISLAGSTLLRSGTNLLAVHVLNAGLNSSDLLFLAWLECPPESQPSESNILHRPASYLVQPTPGKPNAPAVHEGPHLLSLTQDPPKDPEATSPIRISARFATNNAAPTAVHLRYRVMFGEEMEIPLLDNGEGHDATAGDGEYSGEIPPGIAQPGQMIRYCVLAQGEDGQSSRWPLFENRNRYSAYAGTVVHDPAIRSRLPVLHVFSGGRNERSLGDRASIHYSGEFYDNVRLTPHGQYSRMFPKRSYNIDFPYDHRFDFLAHRPRALGLKLLSNYADKSRIRNSLSYAVINAAGSLGHYAVPVRIQRNGEFFSLAEAVEDGDERWLERIGRDPQGALYKMYDNLTGPYGAEKKSREFEDASDLGELTRALSWSRPLEQRAAFAYNAIDLPQCISYFVAMTIISSDDHGHKNFYIYRDSRNTGEWALLPWDVDLSWGRNWTGQYFDERIYVSNPLNLYRSNMGKARNPLYDVLFEYSDFRQMYLRRLRTVMDDLLQAPDTPREDRILEKRILELVDLIDPPDITPSDADLDAAAWPTWGRRLSAREEALRIIEEYLPGRRKFLFAKPGPKLHGDHIPPSQPAQVAIEFSEITANPVSGLPFIRLSHRESTAVDLSGWKLSGAGIQFQFRPGTVIPVGKSLYVVGNVSAFRRTSRRAAEGPIFIQGNWEGTLRPGSDLILSHSKGNTVLRAAAN